MRAASKDMVSPAIEILLEMKKEKISKAYENGLSVDEILRDENIVKIDEAINKLTLVEDRVNIFEKNTWLFTYDISTSDTPYGGYSKLKTAMETAGFISVGDSDYITGQKVTERELITMEDNVFDECPWLLKAKKIYHAANTVESPLERQKERFGEDYKYECKEKKPYNKKSRQIVVFGKTYKNKGEACKAYGVTLQQMGHYTEKHPEMSFEEILTNYVKEQKEKKKSLFIDGIQFENRAAVAKYCGVSYGTLNNYMIDKKCSYAEAVVHFQHMKQIGGCKPRGIINIEVNIDGTVYPSIRAACMANDVSYNNVTQRILHKKISPEEAIGYYIEKNKASQEIEQEEIER